MTENNTTGQAFRPWNVDALADVVNFTPGGYEIRYDHAPEVTYRLTRAEFKRIGRMVRRADFARVSA